MDKFKLGDQVFVSEHELLPGGFTGRIGKLYENTFLVEIDHSSVAEDQQKQLEELHGNIIVKNDVFITKAE